MKRCSKCKQDKELSEFSPGRPGQYRSACKKCSANKSKEYYGLNKDERLDYRKQRYKFIKNYINSKKIGQQCKICNLLCNEENPPFCFDWDHIDRSKKTNEISHLSSIQRIDEELINCQLLCANCHALKSKEFGDYYEL